MSKKDGGGSSSLGSPQVESLESQLYFFQDALDIISCGMGVPSNEVQEMSQVSVVDSWDGLRFPRKKKKSRKTTVVSFGTSSSFEKNKSSSSSDACFGA